MGAEHALDHAGAGDRYVFEETAISRHVRTCVKRRGFDSRQRPIRSFERRYDLVASDRWECVEESIDTVAALEIVDEISERHARPRKDRRAAEDFRIAVHHRFRVRHVFKGRSRATTRR